MRSIKKKTKTCKAKRNKTCKANKTKMSVYAKIDPKRTTIVFDLDETLINTQIFKEDDNGNSELSLIRFPPHSTTFFIQNDKKTELVHLRPYALQTLMLCVKYFNVAFWSSGEFKYVKSIVESLLRFCNLTTKDICFAWGRSDLKHPLFCDVFTMEDIDLKCASNKQDNYEFQKPLQIITQRFSTTNFILFDNSTIHGFQNNKENLVYVPPYNMLNHKDAVLKTMIDIILKLTHTKDTSFESLKKEMPPKKKINVRKVTSKTFAKLEMISPTNNGKYFASGYIFSKEHIYNQMSTNLLKKGSRVIVDNEEHGIVSPAVILSINDTNVKVRIDESKHSWIYARSGWKWQNNKWINPSLPKQKNPVTTRITIIPMSNVRGLYDDIKDAYRFNVPSNRT